MIFNADEVFEIGKQIEVNGGRFYRRAAVIAADPESSRFLLRLAEMETQHEHAFAELQTKLTAEFQRDDQGLADFDQQALAYLKSMADGKVFDADADPVSKLSGQESVEQILRIALAFEKNSVVFYSAVKTMVPGRLGKDKVDALVNEELGHIAMLSDELAKHQKH